MPDTLHAYVSGQVQGVWFRAWTKEQAQSLGVSGWVRNLPDGRVEVEAQGPDDALEELEKRLHQGSPPSRVDQVEAKRVNRGESFSGFEISR
jgi:acylphosphatase